MLALLDVITPAYTPWWQEPYPTLSSALVPTDGKKRAEP
jgi:hypothetical protein